MVTVIHVHYMTVVIQGEYKELLRGLYAIYGDDVFAEVMADKATLDIWLDSMAEAKPGIQVMFMKSLPVDKVDTLMALINTCVLASKDPEADPTLIH